MRTRVLLLAGVLGSSSAMAVTKSGLVDAIRHRDAEALRTLLRSKTNVNVADADGATPLQVAVDLDDVELVDRLIRAGADVKATNRYGASALYLACVNGNAKIIDLLLKAGADLSAASPEGETPLMTASRTGVLAAVQTLLTHGADPKAKEGWHGQTALMWAAGEGHADVVQALLAAGADLQARSAGGFTAFLFAVREGHTDVVQTLLGAGADVNQSLPPRVRRATGATEFHASDGGSTALGVAVENGHYELACMLLDRGANPNADGVGWTPLHTITWTRKPGTGSNDPAPRGSGHVDSLEMVRRLVAHGANVNARMTKRSPAGLSSLNMIGATPFLMAARTADAELMRLLVELGADPNLANADNSTPLMVAAGLGTRSPGEDAGTESEVLEAVKVALECGNDINAVDKNGETAMHGAAYKNLPAVVKYLAEHGAKVEVWNQKNKQGWTPLRIAEGVHRTGNFRASAPTAVALREIMAAAGVSTNLEIADAAAK